MAGKFTNYSIEVILGETVTLSKNTHEEVAVATKSTTSEVETKPQPKAQNKRTRKEAGASTSSDDESDEKPLDPGNTAAKRRKRPRHTYTSDQLATLEAVFYATKGFLDSSTRACLAKFLGVEPIQTQVWFQNRRSKYRKREATEYPLIRQMPLPLYAFNSEVLSLLPPHLAVQIAPLIAQQLAMFPPPSAYTSPRYLPPSNNNRQ